MMKCVLQVLTVLILLMEAQNLFILAVADNEIQPFGLQSNKASRDMIAGSMVYDSAQHTMYVTGTMISPSSTSGNNEEKVNCYLASIRLPTADGNEKPEWQFIHEIGNNGDDNGKNNAKETCFSITQVLQQEQEQRKQLIIAGSTEYGGILTSDIRPDDGVVQPLVYGMVMDIGVDDASPNNMAHFISSNLHGGTIINNGTVQYSLGVVSTPAPPDNDNGAANVDQYVFVASLVLSSSSTSSTSSPLDGINLARHGTNKGDTYSVLLQKYKVQRPESGQQLVVKETMERLWSQTFTPVEGESVSLSSSIVPIPSENAILIAGSTRGYGYEFGANMKSVNDYDGFLTKVNMDDGSIPIPFNVSETNNIHSTSYSARIRTQIERDDYVTAICHSDSYAYVVGYTTGIMASSTRKNDRRRQAEFQQDNEQQQYHGYVQKYFLNSLDVTWQHQLSIIENDDDNVDSANDVPASSSTGDIGVKALACGVTKDGKHLYVAGQVLNGGLLEGVTDDISSSHGGDDIFVSYYDADQGDLLFIKQMGTSQNENLAWGNGGLVVIDHNLEEETSGGSTRSSSMAVLFGDTKGSFMRNRDEENDDENNIFILSVSNDGQYKKMKLQQNQDSSSSSSQDSSSDVTDAETWNEQNLRNNSSKGGMITGILFSIILVVLIVGVIYWKRQQSQKEKSYDNENDNDQEIGSVPSVT